MDNNKITIKKLEEGRAQFAYKCAEQILSIKDFKFNSQKITTNEILRSIFRSKFIKNDSKEEEKKILDDFLENPFEKIDEYSKGENFKKKIANFYEKTQKEYNSYVKKIPMLIKTNGLGATFAFMLSKGGTYEFIGEQVLEWLKNDPKEILAGVKELESFKDLNKKIISLNSSEYRALTIEILSFFNWLRRFAEGLIEGE